MTESQAILSKDNKISIFNKDGQEFLQQIPDKSIHLILTDPPYIISHETGMQKHFIDVQNGTATKTEEEWTAYKTKKGIIDDSGKQNYLKYGTVYGKKYAVQTDYGDWDSSFTIDNLKEFVSEYYKKLVNGGTCIIFFDLWKISILYEMMKAVGFKQLRMIEWIKTNPQPLNSKINYLTNCREIAVLGIKKSKPTFNSKYDNGIYRYPLQGGKIRIHPTQKNLKMFEELIQKHSNENDTVLDSFLGAGTTAMACINTSRKFIGCEIDTKYFETFKQFIP
tara:strand:- start:73 stop:909 length:837 start_codon:yes stop_codon:yes gene_type:complete